MNKANVAHFDGHVDSYREIMPYFYPKHNGMYAEYATRPPIKKLTQDYWLYTY